MEIMGTANSLNYHFEILCAQKWQEIVWIPSLAGTPSWTEMSTCSYCIWDLSKVTFVHYLSMSFWLILQEGALWWLIALTWKGQRKKSGWWWSEGRSGGTSQYSDANPITGWGAKQANGQWQRSQKVCMKHSKALKGMWGRTPSRREGYWALPARRGQTKLKRRGRRPTPEYAG